MGAFLSSAETISDSLVELFNTIHKFPTSADFATWLTDGEFNHQVYEDKIEEGKYKKNYHYSFRGRVFFQGKVEIDLSCFQKKDAHSLLKETLSCLPVSNGIGKDCISRAYIEPYYTVISYVLYKMEIVGMSWKIYNLNEVSIIKSINNKF